MKLPYDIDDPALARATWARLAEPNSATAAMVVGRLGPGPALRWLLEEGVDSSGQVRTSPSPPVPQPPPGMSGTGDISTCWAQVAARWAPRLEGLDIRRELDALDRLGGSLILPGEPWWPPGLNELEHPPFCLWVRGDPSLLVNAADLRDKGIGGGPPGAVEDDDAQSVVGAGQPVREQRMPVGPASGLCLALVGARASTRYGEGVATSLASGVTAKGGLIVSGGAFGIDACAHRGALQEGPTVSVSAGGVDRLYPVGNTGVLEAVIASGPYADTWESLSQAPVPAWFTDAKFGIFTHWGLYTVPEYRNEWYSRNMYIEGYPEFEHHVNTYGPQNKFGYRDFIPMFTAERFDANEWLDLFAAAGARYYFPVSEHHDGYQMYRSELSHWNTSISFI